MFCWIALICLRGLNAEWAVFYNPQLGANIEWEEGRATPCLILKIV